MSADGAADARKDGTEAAVLLAGIARGRGGAEMMLELLAVLHEKGVLSEADVQRVVNVMAADMRDFGLELQGTLSRAASLRG